MDGEREGERERESEAPPLETGRRMEVRDDGED